MVDPRIGEKLYRSGKHRIVYSNGEYVFNAGVMDDLREAWCVLRSQSVLDGNPLLRRTRAGKGEADDED